MPKCRAMVLLLERQVHRNGFQLDPHMFTIFNEAMSMALWVKSMNFLSLATVATSKLTI